MRGSLVKYRVKGLPVVILHDKTMWQEPFEVKAKKNGVEMIRTYSWREVKPHVFMSKIYYRINGQRYSTLQIDELSYPVSETLDIPQRNPDAPFFRKP